DDVIVMYESVVPGEQVLARDGCHSRVFGHPRVRRVGAVHQFGGLTERDLERIVIPAGNTSIHLVFSESYFVITKLRFAQQFEKDFECVIESILEAIPTYGCGSGVPGSFHLGGVCLQEIIQLVAGTAFCAACAPHLAVDLDQADAVCWFVERAAPDASRSANKRQLMVLLEEDDHPIGE